MSKVKTSQKVVLFTCNWHAYSSLEAAGKEKQSSSAPVASIQLSCLGRISPGIILKAFEEGAAGVLLLGCPEGQCHYETGNLEALKVIEETRSVLKLLGYDPNRLDYQLLPAENGEGYLAFVNSFWNRVQNGRGKS